MSMDNPSSIGWLILAATQVMTFLVLWRKVCGVSEQRDIRPQPFIVKPEERPQTREQCDRLHDALNDTLHDMDAGHAARTEALRLEIKADISGIYNRVAEETRGMRSELGLISIGMGEIRGQMKRLLNGKGSE